MVLHPILRWRHSGRLSLLMVVETRRIFKFFAHEGSLDGVVREDAVQSLRRRRIRRPAHLPAAVLLGYGADPGARGDKGLAPHDWLDCAAKSVDRDAVRRSLRR